MLVAMGASLVAGGVSLCRIEWQPVVTSSVIQTKKTADSCFSRMRLIFVAYCWKCVDV